MKVTGKFYISIGEDCHPAFHLKRLGFQRQAFPLDKLETLDIGLVCRLLGSRFEGLTDRDSLSYYPEILKRIPRLPCPVANIKLGVVFGHDFEMEDLADGKILPESLVRLRERYARRIHRLFRRLECDHAQVVFCRRQSAPHEELGQFDDFMRRHYPKLKIKVVAYRLYGPEFAHVEDFGRVSFYHLPLHEMGHPGFLDPRGWDQLARELHHSGPVFNRKDSVS